MSGFFKGLKAIITGNTDELIDAVVDAGKDKLTDTVVDKVTEKATGALVDALCGGAGDKTVAIAEGVTEVDDSTLEDYDEIEKVVFPSTLERLSNGTFDEHSEIKYLDFSKVLKLKKIESGTFYGLDISELNIPEGVEVLEENAIDACKKLVRVSLPSTLKRADSFINDCPKLSSVDTSKVEKLDEFPCVVYGSNSVERLVVPEGVKNLWDTVITQGNLREVFLPSSLESVCCIINGKRRKKLDVYLYADDLDGIDELLEDTENLYVHENAVNHYCDMVDEAGAETTVRPIPESMLDYRKVYNT